MITVLMVCTLQMSSFQINISVLHILVLLLNTCTHSNTFCQTLTSFVWLSFGQFFSFLLPSHCHRCMWKCICECACAHTHTHTLTRLHVIMYTHTHKPPPYHTTYYTTYHTPHQILVMNRTLFCLGWFNLHSEMSWGWMVLMQKIMSWDEICLVYFAAS